MCLLIMAINDYGRVALATKCLLVLIALYSLTGLTATAFQCPLPSPWLAENSSLCPGIGPIYFYNGALNVITDVLVCVIGVAMLWNVQASRKTKFLVIALFG